MGAIKFKKLFQGEWTLENRMILHKSIPIGILNPTCLVCEDRKGNMLIMGKNGLYKLPHKSSGENVLIPIIASKSLILGSSTDVIKVAELLNNPDLSRTYSYICCIAKNCAEVIRFFDILKRSTICYLGCGGIGSLSAVMMAGIGVKKIKIIEFDVIEKSNLNRQIFFKRTDIGKLKADVIKKVINDRFDNVEVEIFKSKINKQNIKSFLYGCEAGVITADDPIGINIDAQMYADKLNIPLVNCGYSSNLSKIYLSPDFRKKKREYKFFRSPESIMPSFGPTNAEIAGLATSILFQVIIGKFDFKKNKLGIVWDNTVFPRVYIN
ncbi:MAG: ThiF family adenylyltransferase [Bacteroidia bacterium]|nr:ThiF family adenylyltransferase [Bacteroidia bacterium]